MVEPLRLDKHIRAATEAANVALWSLCPRTGETWFSDTWFTMLGFQPSAFAPSFDAFFDMMHPDDREATKRAYSDHLEGRSQTYAADFRLRHANGQWRWIGATGSKVDRPGGLPFLIYGMQLDISARKQTEIELVQTADTAEEHRQRLARLAANSPAALFEFRIDADGNVSFPYVTSGVPELLGVKPSEIESDGANIFQNIFEEDLEQMGPAIESSREELSPFRLRYRVKRPEKPEGFIWVQANSVPHREQDGATVWFGSVYDVTPEVEREALLSEARDSMRHLALHDSLTGLPNRRRLDEALAARAEALDSPPGPRAVIIRSDLDRFKYINYTLGHAAGDAVLYHVASVLSSSCGPGDLASRTGGDEFCILLAPGKSMADAEALVGRIQEHLKAPLTYDGKPCRFGASFGIASSDQGRIANGDLMAFADAALYRAKGAGRNCLAVFDGDLHQSILQGRRIAAELETALENNEFEPFFQPQIDAVTGQVIGAEVLARWRLRTGELVTPDRFLPVAEQIRAVRTIDRMMVDRTTAIVQAWQSDGFVLPKVSFNVSAGRLRDASLVSNVKAIQDCGVAVAFELLESILLEEADEITAFNLDLAREAGICIEVDDFGTGHASILGLMQVKPAVLKIDRRLTANVTGAEQARVLVSSIVAIAQSLNVRTVAEGVETKAQEQVLQELGCHVLQGFLYSQPLEAEDFLGWAQRHQCRPAMAS